MRKRNIAQRAGFNWARSSLITEAGVLAKRANQRLREIEKQGITGASNAYQYLRKKSFDEVPWLTIQTQGKNVGKMKFNTNFRGMSDKDIQMELKKIREFLGAKTSLTKGVRSRIEKQTQAFNEKTGQNYTSQEFTEKVMTTDVKEMFKIYDPSDIQALFAENKNFALHADEILQALVAKEKTSLANIDWSTVVGAFHDWETVSVDDESEALNIEDLFG